MLTFFEIKEFQKKPEKKKSHTTQSVCSFCVRLFVFIRELGNSASDQPEQTQTLNIIMYIFC